MKIPLVWEVYNMKKGTLLAAAASFGIAACIGAGLLSSAKTVQAASSKATGVAINATNFPDAKFREYVSIYDANGDKIFSSEEINYVTNIYLYDMGITSLKGIEVFTSLEHLNCTGNKITTLNISKNTKLKELFCDNCGLTSLNLNANTLLEVLSCNNNLFTTLDLSKNTKLTYLECGNLPLTALDVSKNTALENLMIYNTPEITSLNVTNCPNLKYLYCDDVALTSLNVTKNCKLETLELKYVSVSTLDLKNNTQLETLDLLNNALESIDLSKNVNLDFLRVACNPLKTLNVRNNTKLTHLECEYTKIATLDISQNKELCNLDIRGTNISVIDISHCPKLIKLVKEAEYIDAITGCSSYSKNYQNWDNRYLITNKDAQLILFPSDLTGLTASSAGNKTVKLSWKAVGNADGYLIYGKKNGKYAYVGMTTNGTTYTDKKALSEDYNYYWVFPFINSARGEMVTGSCAKYVYAKGILPAVSNLKASSVKGGVKLTWTASAGAEGYLVYGIVDGKPYKYIGMTTQGTTFTDKTASASQYNYYWVYPYCKDASGKMILGSCTKYTYGRALK